MSKSSASRRKKETRSKVVAESILDKGSVTSDISKYLIKQSDCEEVGCNVSVPCPDDAALPCSALSSVLNKGMKDCMHHKNDGFISSKNPSIISSDESHEKAFLSIKKSSNSVSKQKKRQNHSDKRITDFFPVRRSSRQASMFKTTDRDKIIEDAILTGKEDGFEIKVYPDKGRGVITTRAIKRGEFVLEYYGELIDYEEAKKRESIYSDKENIGCYMYYFKFKNKQYCIDATKETDRLGRLVNHSKKGNLKTRTFLIKESPHLVLFADRDIQPGEELSYDYGDRRKTALESHPWLAN